MPYLIERYYSKLYINPNTKFKMSKPTGSFLFYERQCEIYVYFDYFTAIKKTGRQTSDVLSHDDEGDVNQRKKNNDFLSEREWSDIY